MPSRRLGFAPIVLLAGWTCAVASFSQGLRISEYFPLSAASSWTLADLNEAGRDDGFTWAVQGSAPETVGSHTAWALKMRANDSSHSRHNDGWYWTLSPDARQLLVVGMYESADVGPIAGNQTMALSQGLVIGVDGMEPGWSRTSAADTSVRVDTGFFGFIYMDAVVSTDVRFVEHREAVATPRGWFSDVIVLTIDADISAYGIRLPLCQETLFLARHVGLVKHTFTLNPADSAVQALTGGQVGGVPIAPTPPDPGHLTVTSSGNDLSEAGASQTVTITLDTAPILPLILTPRLSDESEARVRLPDGAETLVFDRHNWRTSRVVMLTGVDDADWDGHCDVSLSWTLETADPVYGDTGVDELTLTFVNRDNETIDIADYFVLIPGSTWHFEAFDERRGLLEDSAHGRLTWHIEEEAEPVHGIHAARLAIHAEDAAAPYDGLVNLYSIDASGRLLVHGIVLTETVRRDVTYLGGDYTLVVHPQTVPFDVPLVAGTRGMVTHNALHSTRSALLRINGLPFVHEIPLTVESTSTLLGMRPSKRTPVGTFTNVPYVSISMSANAMGETFQDQGGVLYMSRAQGVICQNRLDQPESPTGMALIEGRVGESSLVADDPLDRIYDVGVVLVPGWNLISVPLCPVDPAPDAVFAGIAASPVWEWRHQSFCIAETIEPGRGYWVHLHSKTQDRRAPVTLRVRGTRQPETRHRLQRGWVLTGVIGEKDGASLSLPLAYQDRKGHAARLGWYFENAAYHPCKTLQAGRGVWLFVEGPGVIDLAPDE